MSGDKSKLIAFNYFGGKFNMVDELYQYFPEHTHFIDVFGGSFAVTLNKKPSQIDTVNDINKDVVNFFKVLREHPEELIAKIALTPVSRQEYNDCFYQKENDLDPIERARSFYVRARQSFYGLGAQRKNKGWHATKTISRVGKSETVSKWLNAMEKLEPCIERLLHVQIENQDFRDLIPKMDFKGAFFYCDPPYTPEVRSSKNDYKHDFTIQDHLDLANILKSIKGLAMVSNYRSDFTDDLYSGWACISFPPRLNNIRSKPIQEVIYMNYDPYKLFGQLTIQDF